MSRRPHMTSYWKGRCSGQYRTSGKAISKSSSTREIPGWLTEVDLLLKLRQPNADPAQTKVSQFMTREPETIDENSSLAAAIHQMSIGGYRHLPVMRDNCIVGILSIKDVLRYLQQQLHL